VEAEEGEGQPQQGTSSSAQAAAAEAAEAEVVADKDKVEAAPLQSRANLLVLDTFDHAAFGMHPILLNTPHPWP